MSQQPSAAPVPAESKPAGVVSGLRPDITPAQIVGGIPIIADLLHSWGVYTLSQAQQDSLSKAVVWAIALIGGDAVIRLGRNLAHR